MYFVKKFQKKIILILDFDWINVNQSLSLHNDLNGLIVVVDFFTTWCGPCKQIAPVLEALSNEFSDKLVILKVDVDENEVITC